MGGGDSKPFRKVKGNISKAYMQLASKTSSGLPDSTGLQVFWIYGLGYNPRPILVAAPSHQQDGTGTEHGHSSPDVLCLRKTQDALASPFSPPFEKALPGSEAILSLSPQTETPQTGLPKKCTALSRGGDVHAFQLNLRVPPLAKCLALRHKNSEALHSLGWGVVTTRILGDSGLQSSGDYKGNPDDVQVLGLWYPSRRH